ncbi:uncharacterized protein LOC144887346 [Branchiostoma floridae x Branchiostoma japonicum]
MTKYSGTVEWNGKLRGDNRCLQIVLIAGLVFLLGCLLVVIVHMAAAIADLSHRLDNMEGRLDSDRFTPDLDRVNLNSPAVKGQGKDYTFTTATNKALADIPGWSNQSTLRRKRDGHETTLSELIRGLQEKADSLLGLVIGATPVPRKEKAAFWRRNSTDPCETHQCQNNATCNATEDGYTCACTEGWRGTYCQQKQRVNQWKKYGRQLVMIALLSVHIPARTDTSVRRGATAMVKVTESATFTQWRDITERRFELQNGQLEIKEPGKYFIYSQVDFYIANLETDTKYSIKKFTEPQLTCVSPMVGMPPRHTCYTAGVLDLESGDKLVLSVVCTECYVLTYDDTTFWGAIKLSC